MYSTQGINRISYGALSNSESDGVQLDYIQVSSGSGTTTLYEADSSQNNLGGTAADQTGNGAPGNGTDVGYVGQGSGNYVQFNDVDVPSSGLYRMLVTYTNDEVYTGNEGGPAFRSSQFSINGGSAFTAYFENTFSWSTWVTTEVDVTLNSGNNTIRMYNSSTSPNPNIESGWAPELAYIQIASAF
jgi:hypothetical protein